MDTFIIQAVQGQVIAALDSLHYNCIFFSYSEQVWIWTEIHNGLIQQTENSSTDNFMLAQFIPCKGKKV